jgi:ubiquinone/menaquinone biosynthesis C-methylase UbiE
VCAKVQAESAKLYNHVSVTRSAKSTQHYYEARAGEYDATSYELVQSDSETAPQLAALERMVRGLPPGRVLDVGCGTGWLTRFLRGQVVALDASAAMLREASRRVPEAFFVRASVPPLPFPDLSFDRVFASHFYSHLEDPGVRRAFVTEARRVASELVVVEESWRPGRPSEAWEERSLLDGTSHRVYKRYLPSPALAEELGGQIVFESPTFVAVQAPSDGNTR